MLEIVNYIKHKEEISDAGEEGYEEESESEESPLRTKEKVVKI